MNKHPIILGIDSSCDDTGIGIVQNNKVLANVVSSQDEIHAEWGGIVPEKASREHLRVIDAVLEHALRDANIELKDIDAIAATYGPGLIGTLLVGLSYGKALAWSTEKPFIPVHHLEGHIASVLAGSEIEPPFLCLIASGGHSSLFDVKQWGNYVELGRTRDDAAGEAFDKTARLLGLGFPGGPALSKLAESGDDEAFQFTLPMQRQKGYDFSFSGLKTAVSMLMKKEPDANKADVAASFERIVVKSLVTVSARAAQMTGHKTIVVAGGVAANKRLRREFAKIGLEMRFPPFELATDNGAMIALAAQKRFAVGAWDVDAKPYLPLASSSA